jgi:acyl-CoA reductase-like NAD-dependent aldehyde dehydrogenase
MTIRALDTDAMLNVAGPVVRQQSHKCTATRPEALAVLLARQRAAFLREGPPSLAERRANLKKLRAAVLARKTDLEAALDADSGHRSRHETAIMEMLALTWGIDYLHRNLRRFMRRERRHVALPMRFARAYVESQPLGVIGIVAPWNYPLSLALMPLATALAAGNRAMIKPSELTPATSDLLVSLIAETFSEDEVAVVIGDAAIGAAFAALPFDHLFFTGSTAVGRAVMRAASEHLVPVTLELGGKSPVLIDRGQPLARAATDIAYGKLANAGQTCVAPHYVLLHEADVDGFVEAWDKAVAALYPAGPASEDYTSIVNVRHYVQDDLPFGGVGASGFGAYHGIAGFRAFSHQKAVFDVGRWNGGALLRPPFRRLTNIILSWMLRPVSTGPRPPIVVRNETVIRASAERVWDVLTDLERWPSWYRACRWVRVESPGTADRPRVFRWKAHPVELRSAVVANNRPHTFAISADALGLHAERTFTLRPTSDGSSTVVISDETQVGPLPWLGRAFLAPRPRAANQAMFDDLARAAAHGTTAPTIAAAE